VHNVLTLPPIFGLALGQDLGVLSYAYTFHVFFPSIVGSTRRARNPRERQHSFDLQLFIAYRKWVSSCGGFNGIAVLASIARATFTFLSVYISTDHQRILLATVSFFERFVAANSCSRIRKSAILSASARLPRHFTHRTSWGTVVSLVLGQQLSGQRSYTA
jgi:hypothetical protein